MTRKILTNAFMVIACAAVAASALPTIKITTSNGNEPPNGTLISGSEVGSSPAYNFQYVSMSKFELVDSINSSNSVTRSSPLDSVRQRGNSTANTDMPKKPYRIKFDERVSLFGRSAAKSWVLLANHMDKTFAMNALAFRLGQIVGLEFTPSSQFVNLEICNPSGVCAYKGIYQLTEQTQVNPGRVDIDEDFGWLVEFNFHRADANDIMFESGSSRYGLSVFIKSPEIDDADYRGSSVSLYPQLTFVRDEFNAILDTLRDNAKFQAGAHRDLIDLSSYAKYVFVQQFLANFEWTQLGYVGSNFAYKDVGGRMKAGPLWDFDLATGTLDNSSRYVFFASSSSSASVLPPRTSMMGSVRNAFYQRLIADEVFRARYRKVWDDHKLQIQALAAPGGFIDSIAGVLKSHVAANYQQYSSWNGSNLTFGTNCFVGCGVVGSGPQTADAYDGEISKLKTWWNNRYSHWNTQIAGNVSYGSGTTYTFDASKDVPDRQPVAMHAIKVGRTPNAGGTVSLKIGTAATIANPDGNHYAQDGDSVRIGSAVNSGYRFTGWTAQPGTSLPSGIDASRDTIKFAINGAIDIKANYEILPSSINAASHGVFINGSRLAIVRNGVNMNIVDKAVVKIYDLNGRERRRVDLTGGSHRLRMDDLPRGLYMVRVSAGGDVRTLRVPVR